MKCLQMALVHDIAEGIVGDFTPYCKITYFYPKKVHNKNSSAKEKPSDKYFQRWMSKTVNTTRTYGYNMSKDKLMKQR